MEINTTKSLFLCPELFAQIVDKMDNSTLAKMKGICSLFQRPVNNCLKDRIISASARTSCLFKGKQIDDVLHDVASNILIIGNIDLSDYKKNVLGFHGGSSGSIFDLSTGQLKNTFDFSGTALKFLNYDPSRQMIIGRSGNGLTAWNLDGSIHPGQKITNYFLLRKLNSPKATNELLHGIESFNLLQSIPANQNPLPSNHLLSDRRTSLLSQADSDRGWICASFTGKHGSGNVKIINLYNYKTIENFKSLKPEITIYSEKKGHLIYLNSENVIRVKDLANKRALLSVKMEKGEELEKLVYNDKNDQLITVSRKPDQKDNETKREWIEVWDVEKKEKIHSFTTADKECDYRDYRAKGVGISCLLPLTQCGLILTGDKFGNVFFWDIEKKKLVKGFKLQSSLEVSQLTFDQKTNQIYVTQFKNPPDMTFQRESVISRIDLNYSTENKKSSK
jgi:hypothetical protein